MDELLEYNFQKYCLVYCGKNCNCHRQNEPKEIMEPEASGKIAGCFYCDGKLFNKECTGECIEKQLPFFQLIRKLDSQSKNAGLTPVWKTKQEIYYGKIL